MKKNTIAAIMCIFSACLILIAFTIIADIPECDLHIIQEVPSNNGTFVAVIFENGCGATTPSNKHISIYLPSEKFTREDAPPFASMSGKDIPEISWNGDRELYVSIPKKSIIYKKEYIKIGISILYNK